MIREITLAHLERHREALDVVSRDLLEPLADCAELLGKALRSGSKVLVFGNGGSAADAQHLAAELIGRFLRERRALPALALTTDSSILTAVANDFGFEQVFRRQVEALARSGDVAIGISTSGRSANVLQGLQAARELGCSTVGLLGGDGGAIAGAVDLALTVAVRETPQIQEMHILIIHLLCDLVERCLASEEWK